MGNVFHQGDESWRCSTNKGAPCARLIFHAVVFPRSGASSRPRRPIAMNAPRNTQYRHLETHRIAGSLGAEVAGVDLSQDLPDDVLAEIRAALLDNCVIFF